MTGVTFRTSINAPNINLVILIIIINVLMCVDVYAVLCCFGLCLSSLAMLKEFIRSCYLCESVQGWLVTVTLVRYIYIFDRMSLLM